MIGDSEAPIVSPVADRKSDLIFSQNGKWSLMRGQAAPWSRVLLNMAETSESSHASQPGAGTPRGQTPIMGSGYNIGV